MNAVINDENLPIAAAVDNLVSHYGRLAVLGTVLHRLVRARPRAAYVLPHGLSDHLLRDIGLSPDTFRRDR
jgi:hypothetical protein